MFQRSNFRPDTTPTSATSVRKTCDKSSSSYLLNSSPSANSQDSPTYLSSSSHGGGGSTASHRRINWSFSPLSTKHSSKSTNKKSTSSLPSSKSLSNHRSVLLAIGTFRLASSSTVASTGALTCCGPASAAAQAAGHSLPGLFKWLIVAGYYIVAFTSLLILLLYLNQFTQFMHTSGSASHQLLVGTNESVNDELKLRTQVVVVESEAMLSSAPQHLKSTVNNPAEMVMLFANKRQSESNFKFPSAAAAATAATLNRSKRSTQELMTMNKTNSYFSSDYDPNTNQRFSYYEEEIFQRTKPHLSSRKSELLDRSQMDQLEGVLVFDDARGEKLAARRSNLNLNLPDSEAAYKLEEAASSVELKRISLEPESGHYQFNLKLPPSTGDQLAGVMIDQQYPAASDLLTYRHSAGADFLSGPSANNRGVLGAPLNNRQASESQWIPIVPTPAPVPPPVRHPQELRVTTGASAARTLQISKPPVLPATLRQSERARAPLPVMTLPTLPITTTTNNQNNNDNNSNNNKPIVQGNRAFLVTSETNQQKNYQHRHHYSEYSVSHHNHHVHHNHHHHHQHGGPNHNRQWRRPRFNNQPGHGTEPIVMASRPNNLYKRVLLCDKTLVSLDFIRNHPIEFYDETPAGPIIHHNHFDDDSGNDINIIDLDTNLDQVIADRHQLGDSNSSSTLVASSNGMALTVLENDDLLATLASGGAANSAQSRSYLTDDDPLVKCDMWDLEKGLKNRKPPREILRMAVKADFDTVRDAINRCRHLSEKTMPSIDEYRDGLEIMSTKDLISLFSVKRGLIPGTKWCGLGDQASSYNDLGPKHRIDICCRAHDHCPIRLKPFRNDYGVLNIALYTKSHCDCDADFYRCLREAHSRMADMLGNLYFNVMKLQCMREERMKICREMKPIALGFERCLKYEESPVKTVFKFTMPPVAY